VLAVGPVYIAQGNFEFITNNRHTAPSLATINQLRASGAALANIGLSCFILHEYVFVTRQLTPQKGLIVWGVMLAWQLMVIGVESGNVYPERLHSHSSM
jgi:hypothetical protein